MIIAQINSQRAAVATASLKFALKEMDIDILCIQEPYTYKNNLKGYAGLIKLLPEEDAWVAALINSKKIEIFQLSHLDTKHIMCFQVISEKDDFYIINVYCQFSIEIEPILTNVERIIKKLKSNKFIITMDANAKSRLWH